MTDQEWRTCDYPIVPMLEFLRDKASDRKLRLFAVACCREIWDSLPDDRCRRAVEIAERFADASASEEELRIAAEEANVVRGIAYRVLETNSAAGGWDHEADAQCSIADCVASVALPEPFS